MMSPAAPRISRVFMPHRRSSRSERDDRSRRTRGVHAVLHRLTRDNPSFDPELRSFLSRNYDLKAIADYEIGQEAEVSADRANLAVQQAKRFVVAFRKCARSAVVGDRHYACQLQHPPCAVAGIATFVKLVRVEMAGTACPGHDGGRWCYAATTDEAGTPSGSNR
jgi:hypothetical protein